MAEQRFKQRRRAVGIGVRQRRARRRPRAQVIEPRLLRGQPGLDLAQALRAGYLAVKQRQQLGFAAQLPHPMIRAVFFDKHGKVLPRNVLGKVVKTVL